MKFSKFLVALHFLALLGVVAIPGCKDKDKDPEPNSQPSQGGLTANAGSDLTVGMGNEVTLDGSASNSNDGSTFSYLWEITDSPSGANATLSGETTAKPTFIANEAGEYTLTLTISNQNGQTKDEVVINVEEFLEPEELGGRIDSDMTLTDRISDPDLPDYIVTRGMEVDADLTVEPGVVVHFEEGIYMDINQTGTLIAEGEDENPIVFTSADADRGLYWQGIYIASASALNTLDHVTVSYAGNSAMDFSGSNYAAGVGVESSGKVSVTNSTFTDNKGYGLYADDEGGEIANFENNNFENNARAIGVPADEVDALDQLTTFSNNPEADVEIFFSTYSASKASTWPDLNGDAAYRVSGRITVEGDLTIAPGVILEFDEGVWMDIDGSIVADGTSSDKITFTSSNQAAQLYWQGIYIASASKLNSFNHVNISYAGNSPMDFSGANYAAGIGVENGGNVSLQNSTISNNKDYGLYVDDEGGTIENFANNHFENNQRGVGVPANEVADIDGNTTFSNNSSAEVEIFSSDFADNETATWNALSGDAAYRLSGRMDVNGVLTLEPGVTIEADEGARIRIYGALIANGTAANPVTFTTSNVPGGLLWDGLYFLSSDRRNELDYVNVSYGGRTAHDFDGSNYKANVGINTDAFVTITNSVFSHSGAYDIYNIGTLNNPSNNTYNSGMNNL